MKKIKTHSKIAKKNAPNWWGNSSTAADIEAGMHIDLMYLEEQMRRKGRRMKRMQNKA